MASNKRAKITEENIAEAEKLKALWEGRPHMSQKDFGERYELGSQGNVGHYLTGRNALNIKAAVAFAQELNCGIEEFSPSIANELANLARSAVEVKVATDITVQDGYIRLEHLSPRPSMGRGSAVADHASVVQHLDVLEEWVRRKVGAANPDRVKVLSAVGTSMTPTISDQDLVFVDVGRRDIDSPGIYVIDVAGRLVLKKALILSDGTLILRSDNITEYPDEERYSLEKMGDSITICGKVLAWWTLKK